jgi:very-short-patch-repair endonuclease
MKNRFGFINKEHAITLRYEQTDAEKILWAELRNRKYKGI